MLDFEQTLDYAELVHRARLIVQDEAVRAAVAASVEALAVDEFSELDPSQLRLLADLCSIFSVPDITYGNALSARNTVTTSNITK